MPAAPHHLDYKYKKVVYVEYTDRSFTQRKNPVNTLLGPLLKGKVSDQIHVSQMFEDRKYANWPFVQVKTKEMINHRKTEVNLRNCRAFY